MDLTKGLNIPGRDKETGIQYQPVIYLHHTVGGGGLLPNDELGAHACWHYAYRAHLHLRSVDSGGVYDGDNDPLLNLMNILHSTMKIYQIEDREEIRKYLWLVKAEAARCQLGWDTRVEDPVGNNNSTSKLIMPKG